MLHVLMTIMFVIATSNSLDHRQAEIQIVYVACKTPCSKDEILAEEVASWIIGGECLSAITYPDGRQLIGFKNHPSVAIRKNTDPQCIKPITKAFKEMKYKIDMTGFCF